MRFFFPESGGRGRIGLSRKVLSDQ
jgi:hypothetical protein